MWIPSILYKNGGCWKRHIHLPRHRMCNKIEKLQCLTAQPPPRETQPRSLCGFADTNLLCLFPAKWIASNGLRESQHVFLQRAKDCFLLSKSGAQFHRHKHMLLRVKDTRRYANLSPLSVLSRQPLLITEENRLAGSHWQGDEVCMVSCLLSDHRPWEARAWTLGSSKSLFTCWAVARISFSSFQGLPFIYCVFHN